MNLGAPMMPQHQHGLPPQQQQPPPPQTGGDDRDFMQQRVSLMMGLVLSLIVIYLSRRVI